MSAVSGWWDDFFWGSLVVVELFFVALIMTILFGLIGAGAKLSNNRVAKSIASGYTIVFRGTPEILVLLLFYFGSAIILTTIAQIFDPEIKFVDFPPFWAGSFAIALIIGSYATETFRGAFLGVDPGQIEAARALGISSLKTFIYVRIPAMWRLALPPFGNHMLSLVKDTALVAIIGL
ncbi:MAG: ABC transporter permease subunit, partial [Pseudomonadota bacterium]|nr:ABC transporter permease subunit [Pseudomonadota bacterium]